MNVSLSTDDKRRIAEATRRACIAAALEGYESAAISGLATKPPGRTRAAPSQVGSRWHHQ